jgi:hypothetical protein
MLPPTTIARMMSAMPPPLTRGPSTVARIAIVMPTMP